MPNALEIWTTVVPEAWIDYNGHLNEGYYAVAFGQASDELLDHLGFDDAYRANIGTFYTVETHIRYLLEVHQGSTISCRTVLAGADSKRLQVHHDLIVAGQEGVVATQESMMLHVAHPGPKAAPMLDPVLANAMALATEHASLEPGDHLGTGVRQLRATER